MPTSPQPVLAPPSVQADPGAVVAPVAVVPPQAERPALDPTRYGDWEKNGRCIDF